MTDTDICPFLKKLSRLVAKQYVMIYVSNGFISGVIILMI